MVYISLNTTNIASYAQFDTQSKIPATLNNNFKSLKDFKSDESRGNDGAIISVGSSNPNKVSPNFDLQKTNLAEADLKLKEGIANAQPSIDHQNFLNDHEAEAAKEVLHDDGVSAEYLAAVAGYRKALATYGSPADYSSADYQAAALGYLKTLATYGNYGNVPSSTDSTPASQPAEETSSGRAKV
jgi:hypothetical protein